MPFLRITLHIVWFFFYFSTVFVYKTFNSCFCLVELQRYTSPKCLFVYIVVIGTSLNTNIYIIISAGYVHVYCRNILHASIKWYPLPYSYCDIFFSQLNRSLLWLKHMKIKMSTCYCFTSQIFHLSYPFSSPSFIIFTSVFFHLCYFWMVKLSDSGRKINMHICFRSL